MDGVTVANLMRKRDIAVRICDWHLVAELDHELARHGFVVAPGKTDDAPATYERAVVPTAKRGPGRPRKDKDVKNA